MLVELNLGDTAKIANLLKELCQDLAIRNALLDEKHEIKSDITILKNGREIKFLDGMETILKDGDEIAIFPLVSGGNQTV